MHELLALFRAAEGKLMERLVQLAMAHGYAKYTSSKREDWRVSIRGLIDTLEVGVNQGGLREVVADEDCVNDPVSAFGVLEAKRHRERGVSLSMFQGLFKYYRQAFLEELEVNAPDRADWLHTTQLLFDRLEIAFCASWVQVEEPQQMKELQEANRHLTNSKNMFHTLVESLPQPLGVIGKDNVIQYANSAFSALLHNMDSRGDNHHTLSSPIANIPWLREALEQQQSIGSCIKLFGQPVNVGGEQRHFDMSLACMDGVTDVVAGTAVLLDEVTAERRARMDVERFQLDRLRMLEAMPLSVVITRVSDNIIQYANNATVDLLGLSRSDFVGAFAPNFYVDPDERRQLVEILQEKGQLVAHEIRLKRGEDIVYCLMSALPISYNDAPCYLFTLLDISTRKRIEEEVNKLSQALQQSPIAVIVTDATGCIEYANKAFEALTGYDRSEVVGNSPDVLKSKKQTADFYDKVWQVLRHGRTWRGEMANVTKDGREYWVTSHISPLRNAKDEPTHFVAFMEDITKRKVAENVLQERLQFIQTLMDAVPTPIFYKNIEGIYQGCNRAFEEYFGIIRPLLIGKTVKDISSDDMANAYHEKDVQLARTGGIQVYESHARRKDGLLRDVIFHKATYRDSKGNPAGIVGSITDITERKRAEREAHENEATLRHVLAGIRAGILVVDQHLAVIEEVNERALELLGGERQQYLAASFESIRWQDEYGRPVPVDRLFQAQSDREYRLERDGESLVPVALTVLPTKIKGIAKILMIFFDMTERKTLERQLNLAQKLESVGQLAAGIAHEINTPIQYIGSNISYLGDAFARLQHELAAIDCVPTPSLQEELQVEVPDAIKDAQEGVQRVASIVQAMRRFSHPGSEEQVAVNINDAIRNTVTIARNEWKYHAEVVLDLDETLPEVICVPGDFNQVVLNILVNAAHAVADKIGDSGQKGEIRISTGRLGEYAEIIISDSGGGIPAEHRNKIFDPFFTTKQVGRGTGQGLAITHAIVDRHHGVIDFTTEPGKGTSFVIHFPIGGLGKETGK